MLDFSFKFFRRGLYGESCALQLYPFGAGGRVDDLIKRRPKVVHNVAKNNGEHDGRLFIDLEFQNFVNSIGIHLSNEGVWIGSKVLIGDFGELESVDCGPFNL